MNIILRFGDSISDAYKQRLQTFVNDVLAQGITENRPPLIRFPGMNEGSYMDIQNLWDDYVEYWRL